MFSNNVFNVSVDTKKWFKASAIRSLKTMAQVASSMIVIGAFNDTAWSVMVQTVIVSGIASLLTSVAGIPEVKANEDNAEE